MAILMSANVGIVAPPPDIRPTLEEFTTGLVPSTGGVTINFDGSEQPGDLVIILTSNSNANPNAMGNPDPAVNKYLEARSTGGNSGAEMFMAILPDPAPSGVTFPDPTTAVSAAVWRFRGADPIRPIDLIEATGQTLSGGAITPAPVEVQNNSSMVWSGATMEIFNPSALAYPTGYDDGQQYIYDPVASGSAGGAVNSADAGTETPASFSWTFSGFDVWMHSFTASINPVLSNDISVQKGAFSIEAQASSVVTALSGLAENDIIVVEIGKEGGGSLRSPQETGYTTLTASTAGALTSQVHLKRVTSTPDTTLTIEGDAGAGDTNDYVILYHVIRGIDPAFNLSTMAENITTDVLTNTVTPNAVTVAVDDVVLTSVYIDNGNFDYISGMPGYTDFIQEQSLGTVGIAGAASLKAITSAGTETPGTYYWSRNNWRMARTMVFPGA